MVSSDYTKEMGLNLSQKKVPLPLVLVLIALIVAAGWYGFAKTWPASHHHATQSKTTAAAPAGAAVTVAGK